MSPRKGNKFLLCAALLSALCSFGAEARKSGPEDWGRYAPDLQKNIRVYFSIPIEFSQEKAGDKTIDQRGRLLIAARHDFYYNPNTYQIDRYNYPKIQEMGFWKMEIWDIMKSPTRTMARQFWTTASRFSTIIPLKSSSTGGTAPQNTWVGSESLGFTMANRRTA